MVIKGDRIHSDDDPLPVKSGEVDLRVTGSELREILDALERIQQQLGQINNGNNLNSGERFE